MNPYVILAAVILMGGAIAGAGWEGFRLGRDHELASQAKQDAAVQASRDAMRQAAAEAISAIEIKNVTVRQRIETEIREKPVYRDCVADARGLQLINAALTGEEAEPAGDRQLPAAPAADGPVLRRNGSEAGRGGDTLSEVQGSGPR